MVVLYCSLEGDVFLDMTGDLLGDLFSRSGDNDGDWVSSRPAFNRTIVSRWRNLWGIVRLLHVTVAITKWRFKATEELLPSSPFRGLEVASTALQALLRCEI